jgi:hypothetical protein
MTTLVVPSGCNGPDASGNGGWTAGALAGHVAGTGPVTVRLMAPPPLEVALDVSVDDGTVLLRHGDRTVATAARGALAARAPEGWKPVSPDGAAAASRTYRGFVKHPFPRCYVCGPERAERDGLRIFPGRLADGRVAAVWHAHDVGVPVTWAALDCIGGWSSDIDERPMVLGQMTAEVLRLPEVGGSYVVVGTELEVDGRKTRTRSELYDAEGDLLAHADQVWIEVDPAVFNTARGTG